MAEGSEIRWPITRRFHLGSGEAMDLIACSAGTVAICMGAAQEYLVAQLSIADLARLGALATALAADCRAAAAAGGAPRWDEHAEQD
ncbi:hypothetical protein F8S13_22135 [Chloroflexia bacterium SDU3-3]|nr:hypothetical protein F8S13_22135 [Chloroflexia bacterium SDU3-3]